MAYVNTATAPTLLTRIGAGFEAAATRYKKYRLYRETLDSLNALTNRELNDLGLSRSELRSVALETTYR